MKKYNKGFTLVEVLATLIVIILLSSLIFYVFNGVLSNSSSKVSKISKENILAAAILYTKEYKNENYYWYDEMNNGTVTGNKYSCTNIQTLINYGFLKENIVDAETNEQINKQMTIKILKDSNEVFLDKAFYDDNDCKAFVPQLKINITGDILNNWYYDNVKVKYTPVLGGARINNYKYYILDEENNKTSIDQGIVESEKTYEILKSGKLKVCGIISNINDQTTGEVCESINVDLTTPNNPVITASDFIESDNWHNNKFSLNISGSENSPSGVKYFYSVDDFVEVNEGSQINPNDGIFKYQVKSCNNVNKCSNIVEYISKLDREDPVIDKFELNTLEYSENVYINYKVIDNISGIKRYKIEYENVKSKWNDVNSGINEIEDNYAITKNGKYVIYVEDYAGNVSQREISVTNYAKLYNEIINISSRDSSNITGVYKVDNVKKIIKYSINQGEINLIKISNTGIQYDVDGGEYSLKKENGTCSQDPIIKEANYQKKCINYTCPNGGTVNGDKCVGYDFVTYPDVVGQYVCSCVDDRYFYCKYSDLCSLDFECSGNYSTSCSNNIRGFPTKGQRCYTSFVGQFLMRLDCKWLGDYNATCSKYLEEYSCSNNEYLSNKKCYSCNVGNLNNNNMKCDYSCEKEYKLWEYTINVSYYK